MMKDKKKDLVYLEYRYPDLYHCFDTKEENRQSVAFIKKWIQKYLYELEKNKETQDIDYFIYEKKQNVQNGIYGERTAILWKELSIEQQNHIAMGLLEQENGESRELFCKVLLAVLQKGEIFSSQRASHQLYLYVGTPYRKKDRNIIEMVEILFLPLNQVLKIFWDEPFMVIGEDKCCRLGASRLG